MAENINLNKQVFNKKAYLKTIDTSFKELGVQTIQEQINEQPTVQEFFDMYNILFYQINELGPTNSHEYLIKTSSEYINFSENNEIIEALQNEIAQLREELLTLQQEIAGVEEAEEESSSLLNSSISGTSSGVSGGSSGGSGGGGY
jgi:hypothetical protein